MKVTAEGYDTIELEEGATAKDAALELGLTGPHEALAVRVNGEMRDLTVSLKKGDEIHFIGFDEAEGKELFWHTSAHVLAQAVLRLFPDAQPTIGPPIENGFYYDFANLTLHESDLPKIEKEMKAIVKANFHCERSEFSGKKEALATFKDNPYKVEIIEGIDDNSEFTAYKQGEFFDLCRGPHLPNLGKIKALKITKTSGAYWRADAEREMLTRIYGITFPDKKLLQDYLHMLEEAKKRDHKVIGPKLGLFTLHEEAPGMPLIHPKGMVIWNRLLDYWREVHDRAGYIEIKTPQMMTKDLWVKSGHWANYRQNMYTSQIEEREWALKPMNCPGGMIYYKTNLHSYRELPLKIGEIGHVHRYEAHGALSGLFRVRSFHQDDAHIYMEREQIQDEILNVLNLADEIYSTFGITYHLELSTRPEKETVGTDEDWELATEGLRQALDASGREYVINEGDGAFYGPKIDFHLRDAIGRSWQCGTIQLDMSLPEIFDLEYTGRSGERLRPIMIHRALYGSIERFLGSLIELYAGKFPFWLSPRQVRLLTVADRHIPYAKEIATRFEKEGIICEVDDTSESVSKKVRAAQLDQVNYMLTIGDREVENKSAALRTRDNVVHGELNLDDFFGTILEERNTRALQSPYTSE